MENKLVFNKIDFWSVVITFLMLTVLFFYSYMAGALRGGLSDD